MARRRYQTGSLFLRGDRWIGRWREDVIINGILHRIRKGIVIGKRKEYPTQKLARRAFDLVLARINAPTYRPGRAATFAEFAERWKTQILAQHKPSTQRAGEWHLRSYLLPEFGPLQLEQVGRERQQALVTKLSTRVAPKTVVNVMGTLSSILNTANDWGYTVEGLNWRRLTFPPRRETRAAHFFTAAQVQNIVKSVQEPWATMFELAAMTGLRAGELLALKVADFDFESRLLCVKRSVWYGHVAAPKSLRSERVLPLPDTLVARLRRYLQTWKPNAEGYLFATYKGNPIPIQHVVQRKLWPALDAMGLPRCGLHAFRHTHSSLLVGLGAPMSVTRDQLGHTDMRLTLGVYSHVIGNDQRAAVERLAGVLDSVGLTDEVKPSYLQ